MIIAGGFAVSPQAPRLNARARCPAALAKAHGTPCSRAVEGFASDSDSALARPSSTCKKAEQTPLSGLPIEPTHLTGPIIRSRAEELVLLLIVEFTERLFDHADGQ